MSLKEEIDFGDLFRFSNNSKFSTGRHFHNCLFSEKSFKTRAIKMRYLVYSRVSKMRLCLIYKVFFNCCTALGKTKNVKPPPHHLNPISTGGNTPEQLFQHYSETRKDFLFKLGNFFH